jgi:hypothetical protein
MNSSGADTNRIVENRINAVIVVNREQQEHDSYCCLHNNETMETSVDSGLSVRFKKRLRVVTSLELFKCPIDFSRSIDELKAIFKPVLVFQDKPSRILHLLNHRQHLKDATKDLIEI